MEVSLSTQFSVDKILIDGEDIVGFFQNITVNEHLYSPVITGTIVMLDTHTGDFISTYDIEGNEDIEFEFTNANDEVLSFKGKLNGMRDKTIDTQRIMYVFDFTSEQVRKNESKFCPQAYKNKAPQEIVREMVEDKLEGTIDRWQGQGRPMTFVGGNRRPVDVIRYVIKNAVSSNGQSSATEDKQKEGEVTGTTGFLCWQTLDGYRFASVDDIIQGNGGEDRGTFTHQVQQTGLTLEESMNSIIQYDFKIMGDFQAKLRAGAFKHKQVNFNMDSGEYSEKWYDGERLMTDKQQKEVDATYTRIMTNYTSNERFQLDCERAQDYQWDQRNLTLSQNLARQNTFDDQHGHFTLPPRFEIRAGDYFEAKIPKMKSEKEGGYDKKMSGRYIVKAVTHHIDNTGAAYTKVSTVRSTTQQDDNTSRNS